MTRKLELIGEVFGELTVLAPAPNRHHGHAMWLCLCSCSKECLVSSSNLRTGHSTSCGHMKRYRLRDYVRVNGPTNVTHADPMVKMHNSVLRSYRNGPRHGDWRGN